MKAPVKILVDSELLLESLNSNGSSSSSKRRPALLPSGALIASGAPPLFVVAAQDDSQVPSERSVDLYRRWSQAGLPAELHLYEKGGHGFGTRARNLPADQWLQTFEAWLASRRLAAPGAAASER